MKRIRSTRKPRKPNNLLSMARTQERTIVVDGGGNKAAETWCLSTASMEIMFILPPHVGVSSDRGDQSPKSPHRMDPESE